MPGLNVSMKITVSLENSLMQHPSQEAPESCPLKFRPVRPVRFLAAEPGLCQGTWSPHWTARKPSRCPQPSLVPFPECGFNPCRKLSKFLRWSIWSDEINGKSLGFLTLLGGREINWDGIGKHNIYHSWTQTHSQIWEKECLRFPVFRRCYTLFSSQ